VTINDDAGSDTVNVGDPGLANGLDNLPGHVTVNGGGSSHVNVNDQAAPFSDAYTLTSSTLSRIIFGGLTYSGLSGLTLNAETGSNTITVVSTSPSTPVTINGDGGTDTLVGPNTANTWNITGSNAGNVGNVTFSGIANLTGGTAADTFKFTSAGSVSGKVDGGGGTNALDYSGDGGIAVTVNLATGAATKTGSFANIQSLVGSSASTDTLIGPNTANTWTLTGTNAGTVGSFSFTAVENLTGGTGNDVFKFTSAGSVSGKVDGGGGTNALDYSGDGGAAATVNLASGTATRTGGFANIQSLVGSSASTDKLIGPNTTNVWSITNNNAGTVGSFSFSAIKYLTGGSGEDVFVFSAGKSISGKIDGGGGTNWLDYAAYTTAVAVNLATNTATGVDGGAAGGIANIRDVRGGQGGDTLTGNSQGNILIGGNGTNTINGGSGRSILIGGKGKDTVTGGSGNDILIAGYTDFDISSLAHDLALDSILAEWQSGNSYGTRINHIKNGGGLNGSNKLTWGGTVHDNSTSNANKLTGAGEPGAHNWFFANVSHTTTNRSAGEQLN
jgi:hypothetical protein